MGSGKGAGQGHRPLLRQVRTCPRSSSSQAWTRAPGPTVAPPPHPACSPALHIQLPPEPSKASLSQGASLLPASQRGSRLKKRMWTEVGFGIRATGKMSSCQRRGLSSPTPGHLSVGGGHPPLGPGTPRGLLPIACSVTCRCGSGAEHRVRSAGAGLGCSGAPRPAGGGAVGACNCDACRPPSFTHISAEKQHRLVQEPLRYKLGCPISTPRPSSPSFSGTMSVKVDGRAQTAASWAPVSLLQNQRTVSCCCSGRGFALGQCWHHHLQTQ